MPEKSSAAGTFQSSARKISFRLAVLSMAFVVASCATSQQGTWVKPGGTQEEFKADYDFCMRSQYESTVGTSQYSAAMADLILGANRLKACMQKSGYAYTTVNIADERLGLGYNVKNGLITNLVVGAPLDRAGFEVCDQIVRVGGKVILYDTDLLEDAPGPVQFVVQRRGQEIERTVEREMLVYSQAIYVLPSDAECSSSATSDETDLKVVDPTDDQVLPE